MRQITNLEIEKTAIAELITYIENQTNSVIYQSMKELEKANELKKIQGLYPKSRIDRDCIRNAIKTTNNNGHSSVSKQTGGISKKKEEDEKYLQILNFLTEVK